MSVAAAVAAMLWAVALAQFPSHRGVPARRRVWYTMILLAMIGTLEPHVVSARLGRLTGLPNCADLVQHLLSVTAATLARHSVASILGAEPEVPRAARRARTLAAGATVIVLCCLFAVSPAAGTPIDSTRFADFPMQFAANPAVIAYWVVFAGYLGSTFVVVTRVTWRYGRAVPHTPLGHGLLLVAAGMTVGLCYLVQSTAVLAVSATGVHDAFVSSALPITLGLFAAMLLLVTVGCALPSVRGWPVVRAAGRYWSLRRLYPLWYGLWKAVPDIALDPVTPWSDRLDPRDLRMRLYRRVIEIRDGYLALYPVAVPGIEERVAVDARIRRLPSQDRATIAVAVRFELARRAELRGDRLVIPNDTAPSNDPGDCRALLAGSDLDGEVRLLRRVAAHRGAIAALAERIEQEDGRGTARRSVVEV